MVQINISNTESGLSVYEILCNAEGCIRNEENPSGYSVFFDNEANASKAVDGVSEYSGIITVREIDEEESRMIERKRIGGLLRNAISERGMTFKEVGEKLGIKPSIISRVVNGFNSTGVDVLSQIMGAIGKQIVFEDIKPEKQTCGTCSHYTKDEFGEYVCDIRVGRYKFVEADQSCGSHSGKRKMTSDKHRKGGRE